MNLNKKENQQLNAAEAIKNVAAESGISAADAMAMAAEHLQPVKEAILDLPAQVYNLSRVTLATRFINEERQPNGDVIHGFNEVGFEQAWEYLTREKAEETTEEQA